MITKLPFLIVFSIVLFNIANADSLDNVLADIKNSPDKYVMVLPGSLKGADEQAVINFANSVGITKSKFDSESSKDEKFYRKP